MVLPEERVPSLVCLCCQGLVSVEPPSTIEHKSIPPIPESRNRWDLNLQWPSAANYLQEEMLVVGDKKIDLIPGSKGASPNVTSHFTSSEPPTIHESLPIRSAARDIKGADKQQTRADGDFITLFRLSKGSREDPIHGNLITDKIGGPTLYKAVSYTWADEDGTISRSKAIAVGRFWDLMPVTANCEAALRRFREVDEDVVLWIDCVCIDQDDQQARSLQVRKMRDIFANATEVLVYLGNTSAFDLAFDAFEFDRARTTAGSQESLRNLFDHAYFHRAWVVQEIANAPYAILHSGNRSLSWSVMERKKLAAFEVLDSVPEWVHDLYNRQLCNSTSDLDRLLSSTSACRASDPRDKIFALFGLLLDLNAYGISANYSLSVQEVYTGITAFMLTSHSAVQVLALCSPGAAKQYSLPSWVPNWNHALVTPKQRQQAIHASHPNMKVTILTASELWARFRMRGRPKKISVHGKTGALLIHATELFNFNWLLNLDDSKIQRNGEGIYFELHRDGVPLKMDSLYLFKRMYSGISSITTRMRDVLKLPAPETISILLKRKIQSLNRPPPNAKCKSIGSLFWRARECHSIFTIPGCNSLLYLRRKLSGAYEIIGTCDIVFVTDTQETPKTTALRLQLTRPLEASSDTVMPSANSWRNMLRKEGMKSIIKDINTIEAGQCNTTEQQWKAMIRSGVDLVNNDKIWGNIIQAVMSREVTQLLQVLERWSSCKSETGSATPSDCDASLTAWEEATTDVLAKIDELGPGLDWFRKPVSIKIAAESYDLTIPNVPLIFAAMRATNPGEGTKESEDGEKHEGSDSDGGISDLEIIQVDEDDSRSDAGFVVVHPDGENMEIEPETPAGKKRKVTKSSGVSRRRWNWGELDIRIKFLRYMRRGGKFEGFGGPYDFLAMLLAGKNETRQIAII
jgi:hypothetical protein